MNPMLCVAAALAVSAVAVVVYAAVSAPEGSQDRRGFHEIKPRVFSEHSAETAKADSETHGARSVPSQ